VAEKSPLHGVTESAGARYAEEGGWLMPADFGDPNAEYEQACAGAALFDRSHQGQVDAVGKEAAAFLHNLCTNDIKQLAVGAGCEALLPTHQAKVVGYVLIDHVEPDRFVLDAGPGDGSRVLKHLDRHLISEQVELSERTSELVQIHVAGPRAAALVGQVLGSVVELPPLRHRIVSLADALGRIRRHDPLGLPGLDLLVPCEQGGRLWQELTAAGARPAGSETYETLRIEAGTPVWGKDIDETNLPQEVGRGAQTISFTKGCYIGQETVARIRTYGHVNRTLVGLKAAATASISRGTPLLRDGQEVGRVTSATFSPRLGAAIGLGYVRRGSEAPGTVLVTDTVDGPRPVEVVALPFLTGAEGPHRRPH
jgi:folate-binding protein YgfZ